MLTDRFYQRKAQQEATGHGDANIKRPVLIVHIRQGADEFENGTSLLGILYAQEGTVELDAFTRAEKFDQIVSANRLDKFRHAVRS